MHSPQELDNVETIGCLTTIAEAAVTPAQRNTETQRARSALEVRVNWQCCNLGLSGFLFDTILVATKITS
jgi:hypothetical protein